MVEVLWHGRGGQGAFTAARLLGAAASLTEGVQALAFPSFGPERRGAPVRAYTKIDHRPIGDRSAIQRADYVVYLDETLLTDGWEQELNPEGILLVNSRRTFDKPRILAIDADGISTEVLGRPIPNTAFLGAIAAFADEVSLDQLHQAIELYMPAKLHEPNKKIVDEAYEQALSVVMAEFLDTTIQVLEEQRLPPGSGHGHGHGCHDLQFDLSIAEPENGALTGSANDTANASDEEPAASSLELESVANEIQRSISGAELEETSELSDGGADGSLQLEAEDPEEYFDQDPEPLEDDEKRDEALGESEAERFAVQEIPRAAVQPDIEIPRLREPGQSQPSLDPMDYARTTCFEAGHLVSKNAGWRHIRPVIDAEACTGCLQCYLYCPDGAIFKLPKEGEAPRSASREDEGTASTQPAVAVDYDFCKGCGVCVTVCKFNALEMVPEKQVSAS